MNFTCLILGILFAAAGVFFYSGRAVNHITAWKSMSEDEKKENTDRTALPECGDYDFHKRHYLYSQRVMESLPR